mmetsp:Transcript_14627/g.46502  ORF Transcript_14627/g.46502 Transcript_14627/m.46502 type:complete len:220 (+) Transcript_14627:170-829(+)
MRGSRRSTRPMSSSASPRRPRVPSTGPSSKIRIAGIEGTPRTPPAAAAPAPAGLGRTRRPCRYQRPTLQTLCSGREQSSCSPRHGSTVAACPARTSAMRRGKHRSNAWKGGGGGAVVPVRYIPLDAEGFSVWGSARTSPPVGALFTRNTAAWSSISRPMADPLAARALPAPSPSTWWGGDIRAALDPTTAQVLKSTRPGRSTWGITPLPRYVYGLAGLR